MRCTPFLLSLVVSAVSCAPYGSIRNPIELQPEARNDVFAALLERKASRIDVEVIAVLGEHHMTDESFDGPKLRRAVIGSLTDSGVSAGSPAGRDGNTVYRVTTASQAEKILRRTWPTSDFTADSEIGLLFKKYPRASVALMECDNQRIFFFDDDDRLVSIYPTEGGGCS